MIFAATYVRVHQLAHNTCVREKGWNQMEKYIFSFNNLLLEGFEELSSKDPSHTYLKTLEWNITFAHTALNILWELNQIKPKRAMIFHSTSFEIVFQRITNCNIVNHNLSFPFIKTNFSIVEKYTGFCTFRLMLIFML